MMRVDAGAVSRAALLLAVTVLTPSCKAGNDSAPLQSGTVSQERFSLSPEQRATLRDGIDPDALERLLAAVPPERRDTVLRTFEGIPGGRGRGRAYITRFDDPELQRLLETVTRTSVPGDPADMRQVAERHRAQVVRRTSVTLALVSDLGGDRVTARVVRRAGTSARDLILLNEADADAGRLTAALNALVQSRLKDGLVPGQDVDLRLSVKQGPRTWIEGSARAWWEEKIQELRSAPLRDIPGVGNVRAMDYRLIGGDR